MLASELMPRSVIIAFGVFLVLAVVVGAWLILNTKPIPDRYRENLSFSLYYPRNLPAHYVVDPSSFKRQGKVLIFDLKASNSPNIAVSEEALPSGLSINAAPNPVGLTLPNQRNFTTAIGPASLSLWGAQTVVSIAGSGTWLILNVTGVSFATAIEVASSFRPL